VTGSPAGIAYTAGPNGVTFKAASIPEVTKKAIVLEINSPSMQFKKPVKISLSVTQNVPKCTVSLKGTLDIADPKSAITGTVKLTNTTSPVKEILLSGTGSEGFKTEVTGANTFRITACAGTPPGVKRVLVVGVKLQNGVALQASKSVSVTPKQTVGKAIQSRKEITLYKATPLTGQSVGLGLKTPANVKLGEVRLSEAGAAAFKFDTTLPNSGFELKRSGENEWTIYFKAGKAPVRADGRTLNANYNLKMELWAEGTYEKNPDGSFKDCLRDSAGNAKSKPRMVTVKVNIR